MIFILVSIAGRPAFLPSAQENEPGGPTAIGPMPALHVIRFLAMAARANIFRIR